MRPEGISVERRRRKIEIVFVTVRNLAQQSFLPSTSISSSFNNVKLNDTHPLDINKLDFILFPVISKTMHRYHHQRRIWDGSFPMNTIHNDDKTYTLQPPAFVAEASIQRHHLELARPESWLDFTDMGNSKAPAGRRSQMEHHQDSSHGHHDKVGLGLIVDRI